MAFLTQCDTVCLVVAASRLRPSIAIYATGWCGASKSEEHKLDTTGSIIPAPECPGGQEKYSAVDLTLMPEPTTNHVRELPTPSEPEPANLSVSELELEATSVPRPEPTDKSISKSTLWWQSSREPVKELWLIQLTAEPAPTLVPAPAHTPGNPVDDPVPPCHLPTP
ncbi:unnamed protein product [Leuciscus chuanchicus]